MKSSRKRRLARAALEGSVAAGAGQALEGFGIVTLASLFPILAVELMGIIDGAIYDYDYVLEQARNAANSPASESAIDKPPISGIVYAIRSIMPLVAALFIVILIILRRPLPVCTFWVDPPYSSDDSSVKSGSSMKSSSNGDGDGGKGVDALTRASMAIAKDLGRSESQSTLADNGDSSRDTTTHGGSEAQEALAAAAASETTAGDGGGVDRDIENQTERNATTRPEDSPPPPPSVLVVIPTNNVTRKPPHGDGNIAVGTAAAPRMEAVPSVCTPAVPGRLSRIRSRVGRWFVTNAPLLGGIAFAQIGMICFNEGLAYAFTALGEQTGTTLPAAFLQVDYLPKSPYYSYAGGLILVLVVVFLLGVLATRAEPALNVLGRTVEKLSGGSFTCRMLIGAVCLGVGVGMATGAAKILFSLPIIYFILGKYCVAVGLTTITSDAITAVGWDSAGVTTGPVTVPFVLSIGIGFSNAVNSPEGFGMLTIASVAPIISVLMTSLLRKPTKAAARTLSTGARSLSRNFSTFRMRRRLKASPSFAMAAFAANAGGSSGPTPDPSTHRGDRAHTNDIEPHNV